MPLIQRQHARRERFPRPRTPRPSSRPRQAVWLVVWADPRQSREEPLLADPAAVGAVAADGHVDQLAGARQRARRRPRRRGTVQKVAGKRALPQRGGGAPVEAGPAAALAPPCSVRAVGVLVSLDRALEEFRAGVGGRVFDTVAHLCARARARAGHPVGVALALPIGSPVEAVALLVRGELRLELVEAHACALGEDLQASTALWMLCDDFLAPGLVLHIFGPRSAGLSAGDEHEAWIGLALAGFTPAEAVRVSIDGAAASGRGQEQDPPPRGTSESHGPTRQRFPPYPTHLTTIRPHLFEERSMEHAVMPE
eukprot:scaffold26720_cov124-Isochrysis_galbana.AAC.1